MTDLTLWTFVRISISGFAAFHILLLETINFDLSISWDCFNLLVQISELSFFSYSLGETYGVNHIQNKITVLKCSNCTAYGYKWIYKHLLKVTYCKPPAGFEIMRLTCKLRHQNC